MRLPFNGNYPLTQGFGENPARYAQFGMRGHNGRDYGLPTGTPVLAAHDGTVHVLSDPPGFGIYIEVVGSEYKTIYAHLKAATVNNGLYVRSGQQIGLSNNTGNSSGPHLHFGAKPLTPNKANGYLGAIDPQPLFNEENNMAYVPDAELADLRAWKKKAIEEMQPVLEDGLRWKQRAMNELIPQIETLQKQLQAAQATQPSGPDAKTTGVLKTIQAALQTAVDAIKNLLGGK